MVANEYKVRLGAFEGPLDLLLFLIRRAEVDVTDIPIADVTDQYLEHLEHLDLIDIDTAGEFLLMAATLMEIKSRCLMPVDEQTGERPVLDGSGDDPRAELIRQLLEYKRYRDAADKLDAHREEWSHRFPAARAGIDRSELPEPDESDQELEDLSLVDLIEAFGKIIETVDFTRLGEHQVIVDETPIELHAEDIVDRIRRDGGPEGRLGFRRMFEGRTRAEVIGLFLALLELCKDQRVRVRLEEDAPDRIVVELNETPAEDE